VGTFSSPLKDVLPAQVDLPSGDGRGIHVFADAPVGNPSCVAFLELKNG